MRDYSWQCGVATVGKSLLVHVSSLIHCISTHEIIKSETFFLLVFIIHDFLNEQFFLSVTNE